LVRGRLGFRDLPTQPQHLLMQNADPADQLLHQRVFVGFPFIEVGLRHLAVRVVLLRRFVVVGVVAHRLAPNVVGGRSCRRSRRAWS